MITPFFRPNVGGVETSLNRICEALDEIGHEIDVLTYQPIVTKARGSHIEKKGGITIQRYQWIGGDIFHRLESHPLLQVLYLCPYLFLIALLYTLKNFKHIDIIHAPGFASALVARLIKALTGMEYVVSSHAIYEGIYDLNKKSTAAKVIRWVLKSAKTILALSDDSRNELVKMGIPVDRISVYTTLVDPKIFIPIDQKTCRKKLGLKDQPTVLSVSRLLPKKGLKVVLEVAKRLNEIYFLFIGTGPMEKELQDAQAKNNNILFVGAVDNKELPVYYNAADVFITIPTYRECFNRTILEALFCGTPVIFSTMDVAAEVIDERAAIAISPNSDSLYQIIKTLFQNRERLHQMNLFARSYADEYFGEKNIDIFLKAYGWKHT